MGSSAGTGTSLDPLPNSLDSTLSDSYKYGTSPLPLHPPNSALQTYLLGYPISHSLAPLLHNTLFKSLGLPWTYTLLESVHKTDLLALLTNPKSSNTCIGAAVTMPHKTSFMTEVDALTPEGAAIGAINTVFIRLDPITQRRRYIGTNTDCIGVREAFLHNVTPEQRLRGRSRPALVVGGGGACRSAIYALHVYLGVGTIYIVNRFASEVEAIQASFRAVEGFTASLLYLPTPTLARDLPSPYFVVGTVPDIAASTADEIAAEDVVRELMGRHDDVGKEKKGVVLEMCYHPAVRTAFYDMAERWGWSVIAGTEAMIWQGVAQQALWTERKGLGGGHEATSEAAGVVREAVARQGHGHGHGHGQ